jgi:hypothetical protein
LGWEHINLTGDYVWHANKAGNQGKIPALAASQITGYSGGLISP